MSTFWLYVILQLSALGFWLGWIFVLDIISILIGSWFFIWSYCEEFQDERHKLKENYEENYKQYKTYRKRFYYVTVGILISVFFIDMTIPTTEHALMLAGYSEITNSNDIKDTSKDLLVLINKKIGQEIRSIDIKEKDSE